MNPDPQSHASESENQTVGYDERDFEPESQAEGTEGGEDPVPPDDLPGPKGGGSAQ